MVASDATHYWENVIHYRPFIITHNVETTLRSYDRLRLLAQNDMSRIIPGHDPLVMQRFPAASKDTEGIAVRLDNGPIHWE